MCFYVNTLLGMFLFAIFGAGCAKSNRCDGAEICNGLDDNCNGKIDEGFVDDFGRYSLTSHCGQCGLDCQTLIPSASEVVCQEKSDGRFGCVAVACPSGQRLGGNGGCVPEVLPECQGEGCLCNEGTLGQSYGCVIKADAGQCAGQRTCTDAGIGACEPLFEETCNGLDDNCNGLVDERFRNDAGQYQHPLHCGGCNIPCQVTGPNLEAICRVDTTAIPSCDIGCRPGFVDLDGLPATGCECRLSSTDVGSIPVLGGDGNCDGVTDEVNGFVFVAMTGSDANPGTASSPFQTIQRAIAVAASTRRSVLIARGVYTGPVVLASEVSLYGGYRPDFRDRDIGLYPVMIEGPPVSGGVPVLRCASIDADTRLDGLTVVGTDSTIPGSGSTAIYSDRCSEAVLFSNMQIYAGRAGAGQRGTDSSQNLSILGYSSLSVLGGFPGTAGTAGTSEGQACTTLASGAPGVKLCVSGDVSGGRGGSGACPPLGCTNGSACGNSGCAVGGFCDPASLVPSPVPNPSARPGLGRIPGLPGALTYNAPTNRGICDFCDDNPTLQRDGGRGEDGQSGLDGSGGQGCGSSLMSVDTAIGLARGDHGFDATSGQDGSGGGGGTAGAGYAVIGATVGSCGDRAGGSGGGGGSGGCGAPLSTRGLGGGASIGVLVRATSRGTAPAFSKVRILAGQAGAGGDGGIGAAGGSGGSGGLGGQGRHWCARNGGRGGDGGRGGHGGGGGGGCGGGSFGLYGFGFSNPTLGSAYRDHVRASLTVERLGGGGSGGRGGFSPGNSGAPGRPGPSDDVFVTP